MELKTSLRFLDQIDWVVLWGIIKDIVLPHSGTLILNCILFLFLGLIIAIVYCIFLYRKGIFKRTPKYYNWVVKLYIPLLIIGILYVFGQWGLIRGIYKIVDAERPIIVTSTYSSTLEYVFENEHEKNEFLTSLQLFAVASKSSSEDLIVLLKDHYKKRENKGESLASSIENKLTQFLINNYGEEIYSFLLYHLITTVAEKGGRINMSDSLSFNEFKVAIDFLLEVGYEDLEKIILEKLDDWVHNMLSSQYHNMVKSLLILLIIMMITPLIEFFIYKKWIIPKYNKQLS